MINFKEKKSVYVKHLIMQFMGCMFISVAVKVFSAPNHIAPGGAAGISTMLNYLFGVPIGSTTLFMNVPLLILAYKKLGKRLTYLTLIVLVISSFTTDIILANPTTYSGDPMLAAIFGGVINGIGISLIFMTGATSGGSDIINKLIQKKYPYFSTGQLVIAINGTIMCSAAFVYGELEASLYGLIFTFTCSKMIDTILYGVDMGKSCTIVTTKPDEISEAITTVLNKSATLWQGEGAYKKNAEWVLICVVRKQEFYMLKKITRSIDPQAFIIVSDAKDIVGGRFKNTDK